MMKYKYILILDNDTFHSKCMPIPGAYERVTSNVPSFFPVPRTKSWGLNGSLISEGDARSVIKGRTNITYTKKTWCDWEVAREQGSKYMGLRTMIASIFIKWPLWVDIFYCKMNYETTSFNSYVYKYWQFILKVPLSVSVHEYFHMAGSVY